MNESILLINSTEYHDCNFDTTDEILWEQYKTLTELHKFYLDLLFKAIAALNLIISGFVGFILSALQGKLLITSLAFLLPAAFSFGIAFVFRQAIPRCSEFNTKMHCLVKKLRIGVGPHITLTINSCKVFFWGYLLAGFVFTGIFLALLLKYLLEC